MIDSGGDNCLINGVLTNMNLEMIANKVYFFMNIYNVLFLIGTSVENIDGYDARIRQQILSSRNRIFAKDSRVLIKRIGFTKNYIPQNWYTYWGQVRQTCVPANKPAIR